MSSCCFQPMESGKIVTTSRMPFITAMPHSELLLALGMDSSIWPLPLWLHLGSPVITSYGWVLQCVHDCDISVIYSTFIYMMAHHGTHLSSNGHSGSRYGIVDCGKQSILCCHTFALQGPIKKYVLPSFSTQSNTSCTTSQRGTYPCNRNKQRQTLKH